MTAAKQSFNTLLNSLSSLPDIFTAQNTTIARLPRTHLAINSIMSWFGSNAAGKEVQVNQAVVQNVDNRKECRKCRQPDNSCDGNCGDAQFWKGVAVGSVGVAGIGSTTYVGASWLGGKKEVEKPKKSGWFS